MPDADSGQPHADNLDRQIEIIQPKIIATLGRFSMVYVMERLGLSEELKPISVIHGRIFKTKTGYGDVNIVPLYHPAAALYTNSLLESLKKDFQALKKFV